MIEMCLDSNSDSNVIGNRIWRLLAWYKNKVSITYIFNISYLVRILMHNF